MDLSWLCWVSVAPQACLWLQGVGAALQLWWVGSRCGGFSCVEHGLQGARASAVAAPRIWSTGSGAVVLSYSSAHPGPGIEPVSPALASRFFTTEPSGKPLKLPNKLAKTVQLSADT